MRGNASSDASARRRTSLGSERSGVDAFQAVASFVPGARTEPALAELHVQEHAQRRQRMRIARHLMKERRSIAGDDVVQRNDGRVARVHEGEHVRRDLGGPTRPDLGQLRLVSEPTLQAGGQSLVPTPSDGPPGARLRGSATSGATGCVASP